jgi:hypothetical protein
MVHDSACPLTPNQLTPEDSKYTIATLPSCRGKSCEDNQAIASSKMGLALVNFLHAFYKIGVPVFINDGLLLGVVRGCSLNENDHDLDLAIFGEDLFDVDPATLRDTLIKFCPLAGEQSPRPYCGGKYVKDMPTEQYNGWVCGQADDAVLARPYYFYCNGPNQTLDINILWRHPRVLRHGFQENASSWRRNGWGVIMLQKSFELAWVPFAGTHILVPYDPIETIEWLMGSTWNQTINYTEYWSHLKKYPPMGTSRKWADVDRSKHGEAFGWNTITNDFDDVLDEHEAFSSKLENFCWEKARKKWVSTGGHLH